MPAHAIEPLKPTELPAPPVEMLQVVQACGCPDMDLPALSELVARDPMLTAELLRLANSPYFGLAGGIKSIARAVTVIGQRALRNMVLCIAMRDALRTEQLPAFPLGEFWESSLRRAVCARALAGAAKLDEDECFTVGLLQDFGLLVLFYLRHHRISDWTALNQAPPDERYQLERQLFGQTHDRVGLQLAEAWNLPAELGLAMGHHHQARGQDLPPGAAGLCAVAECADWMAAVFTAEDKSLALRACRRVLAERFELRPGHCDGLLDQVAERMSEAAGAMGLRIGVQPALEDVLRETSLQLLEENLSVQEMNWHMQRLLEERDRVAAELHRELELAREVQRSLLPDAGAEGLGVFGLNLAARQVSGDFYDFFPLAGGSIAFCIADVAGKGMNAALLMAKASSLFRCLGRSLQDPSRLLAMLNREIAETSVRGMFVTMIAGVFDPARRRLRLANAGHVPALEMAGPRLVREYPASAPPLGVVPEAAFPCVDVQLADHSLYLYTDGLLEARVSAGQRMEREGLLELIGAHCAVAPVDRLQGIVAAVRGGHGGIEDDLTLLLIES